MTWINAIVQGVLLGGLYAMFAAGLSLMFGVMRIVNLAHGALALVAAYAAYVVTDAWGVNPFWSLLAVVPGMAIGGWLVQRTILNRTVGPDPLPSLLVTFGLAVVLQNALLQVFSADSRALQAGGISTASLRVNSSISLAWFGVLVFGVALLLLGSLSLLLNRTRTGRVLRATADDSEAVILSGVDPRRVYALAAALSFATVALAGVFMGMGTIFDPSAADARLIFAFETVIIGALGNLWGTMVGGVILGVTQTVGAQVDPSLSILAGHLAFLTVLMLRPQGLSTKVSVA
jgi:branched-chain amino acid transport system permease protein